MIRDVVIYKTKSRTGLDLMEFYTQVFLWLYCSRFLDERRVTPSSSRLRKTKSRTDWIWFDGVVYPRSGFGFDFGFGFGFGFLVLFSFPCVGSMALFSRVVLDFCQSIGAFSTAVFFSETWHTSGSLRDYNNAGCSSFMKIL